MKGLFHMTQADHVLSTPPVNTPIDTTRRHFLSQAAAAAGGTALALAATPSAAADTPASPIRGPYSAALIYATRELESAHNALQAAGAAYDAADDKAQAWERQHPQPKSRRGIRKWIKKAGKVHEALVRPSWLELVQAEQVFADAQIALAKVVPADEQDLTMMACLATIYDDISLTRRNTAPISRVVAFYFVKFRLAAGEA